MDHDLLSFLLDDVQHIYHKLDLLLARRRKSLTDLRSEGLSPQTLTRIRRGKDVKPKTAGSVASALEVDVLDIIQQEGE